MAGTKATVTTETITAKPAPPRKKKRNKKADLSSCGCCSKKLKGFVAADGLRFCSDDCATEYLS